MKTLETAELVQMRLAHLSLIQGVVGRMSNYSAAIKTLCVTLVAGVIALGSTQENPQSLILPTILVLAFFSVLDAYYLALERSFRVLYASVVDRDLLRAAEMSIENAPLPLMASVRAFFSPSVFGFFGSLAAIFATTAWVVC